MFQSLRIWSLSRHKTKREYSAARARRRTAILRSLTRKRGLAGERVDIFSLSKYRRSIIQILNLNEARLRDCWGREHYGRVVYQRGHIVHLTHDPAGVSPSVDNITIMDNRS